MTKMMSRKIRRGSRPERISNCRKLYTEREPVNMAL